MAFMAGNDMPPGMRVPPAILWLVVCAGGLGCGDSAAGDPAAPGGGEPAEVAGEGEGEPAPDREPSAAERCELRKAALYGPGGALERIERASCDAPLGGPDWTDGTDMFEAQAGYEQELAEAKGRVDGLPDPVDTRRLNTLELGYVGYALEATTCEQLPTPDDACTSDIFPTLSKEFARSRGKLGEVVLAALARGPLATPPAAMDFVFLRRGLHRYYACSRPFPPQLATFRAEVFDYTEVQATVIDSFPKVTQRRIRQDACLQIVVAEAISPEGEVHDTEILMAANRADGSLDFLAYEPGGALVDRGSFATTGELDTAVVAASPYVCTSCHINRDVRPNRFDVLFPIMRMNTQ